MGWAAVCGVPPVHRCDDGQKLLTSPGPRSDHRAVMAQVMPGEQQGGGCQLSSVGAV